MKKLACLMIVMAALAVAVGLCACASTSGAGSSPASSGASTSANMPSATAASAPDSASPSAQAAPSAVSSAPAAPSAGADGKQEATGTVVTTTYKERAAEVGLAGDDFANDTGLLTLLVLDEPIQVTAYKGGSDFTGVASVIRLPNDEMFRQFSGQEATIAVDSWGEWPADITGKLYDLMVEFDSDGLTLVER